MIRFKCIYCGQSVLAPRDGIGRQGKCPKCSHILRVPKTTEGRPAIGGDRDAAARRRSVLATKGFSPTWDSSPDYAPEYLIDEAPPIDFVYLYGEKAGWLIPTYDELSLFLTALATILLFALNGQMRTLVYRCMVVMRFEPRLLVFGVFFLGGLCLCLYHAFAKTEKTYGEKQCMLFFAVMVNAITAILAGIHLIKGSSGWLLIFPIWNITNGILLLLMLWLKIINETCIRDRKPTAGRIVTGSMALLIIFALCNFAFRLYWALTFSICIIYATSVDRALQSTILGRDDSPVG